MEEFVVLTSPPVPRKGPLYFDVSFVLRSLSSRASALANSRSLEVKVFESCHNGTYALLEDEHIEVTDERRLFPLVIASHSS